MCLPRWLLSRSRLQTPGPRKTLRYEAQSMPAFGMMSLTMLNRCTEIAVKGTRVLHGGMRRESWVLGRVEVMIALSATGQWGGKATVVGSRPTSVLHPFKGRIATL